MRNKTKPTLIVSNPKQIVQDKPVCPPLGTPEEEAQDERPWEEDFAANKDVIAEMAAQAREERRLGKSVYGNPWSGVETPF